MRSLFEFVGTGLDGSELLLELSVRDELKIPNDSVEKYALYRILGDDKVLVAESESKDYIDGLVKEWLDKTKK